MPCCCNINFEVDVVEGVKSLWPTLQLIGPKSRVKKLEKKMITLRNKRDDINQEIEQAEREGRVPTNQVRQWLEEVRQWLEEVATSEGQVKQDFQSMNCFSCNCFRRTAGTSSQTQPEGTAGTSSQAQQEGTAATSSQEGTAGTSSQTQPEGTAATSSQEGTAGTSSQTQQEGDIALGKSSNCCSIIRRVANKLDEADGLMSRIGKPDSIPRVRPPELTATVSIVHRPSVGIESYEKDIVDYIDGEKGNIIGIYGMGGIGKTTILNSIQRHYLIHSKFDRVIWVVASKACQVKNLQKAIAKSLGLKTLKEDDDEKTRGDYLFNYLKNKKCLLLLDDIWGRLDLRLLGMAYQVTEQDQQQQQRKVVVLTTRSETVCEHMKAEKKIKVKCLDPDSAWQLFERNYEGDALSSDAGIKWLARELVKECAGLPLALVTVARAMIGKKSQKAWRDALDEIRDKHDWTTNGLLEDSFIMYNAFKLSYDSLGNNSIRECLLCCALWPEDHKIDIFKELIPCWIGCGIIREFNVINKAFNKGCSHLDALLTASLLEHSPNSQPRENYVKMHDVIRDMALFMVSRLEVNKRKWIVKAQIGLSHLPRQEEWQEAERASFMWNEITSLQYYEASTFSNLSMLLLRGNRNLKIIPPSLFASMPCLTYLDIAFCDITELPMEICSSTELQYLDLSFNPITTLPAEFGCLSKLEYLILKWCEIEIVPNGTISNLSVLRWLDCTQRNFLIYQCWLNELKCFKGRHQLSVAIRIHDKTADIERLNMLSNVSIWDLTIDGYDASELPGHTIDGDDKLVLSTLQWCDNISDNLESLCIVHVNVDILIFHESRFRSLEKLIFRNLPLLKEISLNGVALYNLRELHIVGCDMLKDVSWVLQLLSLNLLYVYSCPRMKELISDIGNSNSISSIKILTLWGMANLTCIANQPLHFPCLEYMKVAGCPELKKLSFGAEILNSRLKEIEGDETWWSNLEWDNESDKNSLTPYFIRSRFRHPNL